MPSTMAAEKTGVEKWIAKMKVHHAHHPVITGYAILGVALTFIWGYQWTKLDHDMMCIQKYRKNYIVIRPDDPAVNYIKKGKIGLDH